MDADLNMSYGVAHGTTGGGGGGEHPPNGNFRVTTNGSNNGTISNGNCGMGGSRDWTTITTVEIEDFCDD
jgi:hypothetical protein